LLENEKPPSLQAGGVWFEFKDRPGAWSDVEENDTAPKKAHHAFRRGTRAFAEKKIKQAGL